MDVQLETHYVHYSLVTKYMWVTNKTVANILQVVACLIKIVGFLIPDITSKKVQETASGYPSTDK